MFITMNKIILITNPVKVALLADLGFTPCGARQIENKGVSQFIVTDELLKVINDEALFNKKDYVYDTRLTF